MASLNQAGEVINAVGEFFGGSFRDGWRYLKKGPDDFFQKAAHEGNELMDIADIPNPTAKGLANAMFGKQQGMMGIGNVGDYNAIRIGGTVAGLGLGYRFVSGGGLYRDKDGNTDIAGIPFV